MSAIPTRHEIYVSLNKEPLYDLRILKTAPMVMYFDLLWSYLCHCLQFYTHYRNSLLLLYYVLIFLCRNSYTYIYRWGPRWRSWLRHCATSQKVAGSIPDGVIGILH